MKQFGVKKITIALFLVLVIFQFFAQGWHNVIKVAMSHNEPSNLSFSFERCDSDRHVYNDRIRDVQWNSKDQLVVQATVAPNCGSRWLLGSYSLKDSDLTLTYQPVVSTWFACICSQNITYEIAELPKKEYKLTLKAEPEIDAQAEWFWNIYSKL